MSSKVPTVESYKHEKSKRVNNPPVGLVTPATDPGSGHKTYEHDPHIDPHLSWGSKAECTSFDVPTVSLHVHERIDPSTIIEAVRKKTDDPIQPSLFAEEIPIRKAIEFYKHRNNWANRLIAGDSLLVMNSLLEKEGMCGHVQMVYIDPPYGIKYSSNFQPFVSRIQVTEGKDITGEPEQIRAFRDTWELGIHSYLSYMRDRLLLSHALLHESGSCFVQIGKENVHRMALLMDEIFGAENRVTTITYATSGGGSSTKQLPEATTYLLWYAKDNPKKKYHQLYERMSRAGIMELFSWHGMVELSDGSSRRPTKEERFGIAEIPESARLFKREVLSSQGTSTTGRSEDYKFQGRIYKCVAGSHWRVSMRGLDRLAELDRLISSGAESGLRWKLYEDEVPGRRINNVWSRQKSPKDRRYVVQTAAKIIQRCILMTTDPGDLLLDITCGSGTTAAVAEAWGRRWITCDTSRVAVAVARQRLMTATYPYYQLAQPDEGVGSGFVYKEVHTVTAGTLAYDDPHRKVTVYDQPLKDRRKGRVTGPFTTEAVPAPTVTSIDEAALADVTQAADESVARTGPTVRHAEWRDALLKSGIRAKGGQYIEFTRLEPRTGFRWLHADGVTQTDQAAALSFGPDHAPLEQRQVALALEEAQTMVPSPKLLVFAAFQFDPEASKDIDEINWPGVTLLKANMNADLLTDDLKKKHSGSESFWLIGQPDVALEPEGEGQWRITVRGFDYFDIQTGKLQSGSANHIALWMLDTDYDGRSLYPRQVFFPMAGPKRGWQGLAKTLKGNIDHSLIEAFHGTRSLPFREGVYKRAAVKIVDDRGIESLKIVPLGANR